MKIQEVHLNKFKRFTDLTIKDIPESVKLVVLVGPNGCGKHLFLRPLIIGISIKDIVHGTVLMWIILLKVEMSKMLNPQHGMMVE